MNCTIAVACNDLKWALLISSISSHPSKSKFTEISKTVNQYKKVDFHRTVSFDHYWEFDQMAMRAAAVKSQVCLMESSRKMIPRYFSSDGRVFSEEEKAAENIYIKKMERERIEKAKKKLEKEKAAADKDKSDKKSGE